MTAIGVIVKPKWLQMTIRKTAISFVCFRAMWSFWNSKSIFKNCLLSKDTALCKPWILHANDFFLWFEWVVCFGVYMEKIEHIVLIFNPKYDCTPSQLKMWKMVTFEINFLKSKTKHNTHQTYFQTLWQMQYLVVQNKDLT